jgi:exosortase D (VPLPA-CTERM-specific)
VIGAAAALLYLAFGDAIAYMVSQWNVAEFSHGYLIPCIAAFLVWQRLPLLSRLDFKGSWAGVGVLLVALGLNVVGRLSALYLIQHIALLIAVAGLVLSFGGWQAVRVLRTPLCILIFMVPIPNIFLNPLSSQLQLVSSSIGVWLIRLLGVAALQNGNVIDLGNYQLEVAEACSGLRYLFPLMTLAFLVACFYRANIWKRAIIFLSSIPITVLMNSLRIATIGIMVDRWGVGMAEGMLHEVQGWMMFMLSAGVLLLELILLNRIGRDRRPWREAFSIGTEQPQSVSMLPPRRSMRPSAWAAAAALATFSIVAIAMPNTRLDVPARESFASFPLQLGSWNGRREDMERIYLDALKLDDYLLADYTAANGSDVNLYVAWYNSQEAGGATHSPRACLPGGGWRIVDLRQVPVDGVSVASVPLTVNRALIEYGDQRELVYYWFMQRGRVVTSEYLVKWYLLVDALLRHRTDGALVRLIVPLPEAASPRDAEERLQGFAATVVPRLASFVPG